ncbi:MAG: SCO family protein [Phycisphaerales bacterium]|nr:SCO family protein [Phycisphaerales bacterium]
MNYALKHNPITALLVIMTTAIALLATPASAQRILDKDQVRQLNGVDLVENQGAMLPMDAVFTTADGKEVALAQYFLDDKPTILALVYYECPIVCPTVLRALSNTINELDYTVGEDYRVLVISFDHREGTTQALNKREDFINTYTRAKTNLAARRGIEFFTGSKESIQAITASIGFEFNEINGGEYAHPISLMAISPKGKLTRYLYGYDYPANQLKLTLLDASQGKIAKSWGDRFMHFCYRYDPLAGSYSLVAFRVMQVGALLGAFILFSSIGLLFLGESKRRKKKLANNNNNTSLSTTAGNTAGAAPRQMS